MQFCGAFRFENGSGAFKPNLVLLTTCKSDILPQQQALSYRMAVPNTQIINNSIIIKNKQICSKKASVKSGHGGEVYLMKWCFDLCLSWGSPERRHNGHNVHLRFHHQPGDKFDTFSSTGVNRHSVACVRLCRLCASVRVALTHLYEECDSRLLIGVEHLCHIFVLNRHQRASPTLFHIARTDNCRCCSRVFHIQTCQHVNFVFTWRVAKMTFEFRLII